MKLLIRGAVALIIIAAIVAAVFYLFSNAPSTEKRTGGTRSITPQVTVLDMTASSVHIPVTGFASVQAGEQVQLVAEVKGRITSIASAFTDAGQVRKGAVLVQQSKSRFVAAYNIAKAELEKTQAQLQEEQAKAKLALLNWKRAGNTSTPDPLVVRAPQLVVARANINAAKNRLRQAGLDIAATTVKAPFDGIVVERLVDSGQFVSAGSSLGTVMNRSYHQIRLAVTGQQLDALDQSVDSGFVGLPVTVTARVGDSSYTYAGKVNTIDARVDTRTRLFGLIIHVNAPFDYDRPLYPGQFVHISVPGVRRDGVFSIPISAIDRDDQVALLVDGRIQRVRVSILSSSRDSAMVRGLGQRIRLITSNTSNLAEGTPVQVRGIKVEGKQQGGRDQSDGNGQ